MTKYNHMFTIAFTAVSEHPTADDMKGKHYRTAIMTRLASMDDDEFMEACGLPDDSYEVTED